jgi:hypothetical protein
VDNFSVQRQATFIVIHAKLEFFAARKARRYKKSQSLRQSVELNRAARTRISCTTSDSQATPTKYSHRQQVKK